MKEFIQDKRLTRLLRDRKRLKRLLALEKKHRGLPEDALTFIGMRNVAGHWWCSQQAVLDSRAEEIGFFSAYLEDRIVAAHRLGLVNEIPQSDEAILDIGREISLADVEKQLRRRQDRTGPQVTVICEDEVDKNGKRTRFINPDLPEDQTRPWKKEAEEKDISVISVIDLDPLQRGNALQGMQAEKYPTLRWNFPWHKHTVVGIPDGITDEFVYEYKTTRKRGYVSNVKPVAIAQADLYGYFFRRPRKRVQIQILEEKRTETYEEPVSSAKAEETLVAFARVDEGEPAYPPQPWKCRSCKFKLTCTISQAR